MKKVNVLIACDNAIRKLGEMLCEKFLERREQEASEAFYVTGDNTDIQQTAESIVRDKNIGIFVNLNDFLDLSRIKNIKPCKHLFAVGYMKIENMAEQEAFEAGFNFLRKARYNLLLVQLVTTEKQSYLIVYPEKTYEAFSGPEKVMKSLAMNMLKRENVSHAQSIQESENAEVPEEVFEKFHSLGKALFEKGLLPIVEGGTYGNFSMMHESKMYITGRGADKGNLPKNHIVRINRVVGMQHLASENPSVYARIYYSGATKPSIDTAINYELLKKTNFRATVHIHTDRIFANLPMTGYNYPCGAKEELDEIMSIVENNPAADIIQQYRHGLVVLGNDFEDCLRKIESLFSNEISARKINEIEEKEKEFRQWEEHYKKNTKGKNVDLDIHDLSSLYVVQKGEIKVGLLYLKAKKETLYFVFYSLEEFTRKKLGLGEKVIDIVSKMAKSEQKNKVGILTTRECNVIPYYEGKGFRIINEKEGSIWMEKEV